MSLDDIHGVLFDVDGTLLVNDRPVPGAVELLARLRARGLPFRITTNISRWPRTAIAAVLRRNGFAVEDHQVLAPGVLACRRILQSGRPRAAFLLPEDGRSEFEGLVHDEDHPDWVVIGDLGRGFTWERLNRAYRWVEGGARLLAFHRNRAWDNGIDGVVLDAGPFVAALEYATRTTAVVVGKPDRAYFDLALADLGVPAAKTLVVGDDLETDIAGGAGAGCRTAIVLTGNTAREAAQTANPRPDFIGASVADLPIAS
jgi:HAD superfamily hydrolase (TIGR01458 family)